MPRFKDDEVSDARYRASAARRAARLLLGPMLFSLALFAAHQPGGPRMDAEWAESTVGRPPMWQSGSDRTKQQAANTYSKLPLTFVRNSGQVDDTVRFYARGSGYAFYFTPRAVVVSLIKDFSTNALRQIGARRAGGFADASPSRDVPVVGMTLALRFLSANPNVSLEGAKPGSSVVNHILGSDPKRWHAAFPTYERIVYRDLWDGVDLAVGGRAGELKYEFIVKPGARVEDIRLAYDGAQELSIDTVGNLLIKTSLGVLRDRQPVSYQIVRGRRVPLDSRYVLPDTKDGSYGFALGTSYDPTYPLVIDPGLAYSTFLGGSSTDLGLDIAVDREGAAYVTGPVSSFDFPTTPGAYQTALSDQFDAFVTKVNASGTGFVYSTFIGGTNFDAGFSIRVDTVGDVYVQGRTSSVDFPTTPGAYDTTFNGDGFDLGDVFVAKLNANGSALVYSTYLGGTASDHAQALAIDREGSAYVAGDTESPDFPTTPGAHDLTLDGGRDAFLTKLNSIGSALVYSSYLGGGGALDVASANAVDASGTMYVTGITASADFPTSAGAYDRSFNGGSLDVFIVKLNPAGSDLVYGTYIGGPMFESSRGLDVDADGNAYVGGITNGGFPTTPGAYDTTHDCCGSAAFVTKVSSAGSALLYSTYLGETDVSQVNGIAVHRGNAYAAGNTSSAGFPTTADAHDRTFNGVADAFLAVLNPMGSELTYATFLGGERDDVASSVAVDPLGDGYVTGHTFSTGFPVTPGAPQTINAGGQFDGFVTKLTVAAAPQELCGGRTPTLVGTDGNDVLIGGRGADVIDGLGGNDRIEGRSGGDVLCGGLGFDILLGGDGDDRLVGQSGNDGLDGGAGRDLLLGGNGADVLEGGSDADELWGGEGNDGLYGQAGGDLLEGEIGADALYGGTGNDALRGRGGADQLFGNAGDDRLDGGDAVDRCDGSGHSVGDTAVACETLTGVP